MSLTISVFKEHEIEESSMQLDLALQESGCVLIELSPATRRLIAMTLTASHKIFQQTPEHKSRFSDKQSRIGFRSVGIEYSASPDRPDLMEALSYSLKFERVLSNLCCRQDEVRWVELSRELFGTMDDLFNRLLNSLFKTAVVSQQRYALGTDSVFAHGSFLQTNNYAAGHMIRDILQDCHEDGTVATLLTADQDGLEVSLDCANFTGCNPTLNRLLFFGGSLLTKLSSGRYPTVYHKVVRHPSVTNRTSMMYFASPAPERPFLPWDAEDNTDLNKVAAEAPSRFGLPNL